MIKCKKCSYEWEYRGKENHASCPKCDTYNRLTYILLDRFCDRCKKEFKARNERQRFCSYECRIKDKKENDPKRHRAYYLRNRDKIKAHYLEEYYKNRDKISKYQIARMERIRKDKSHPAHKKYIIRHIKTRARKYIIQDKCEICGSEKKLERHHWRYDNPKLIALLCKDCHSIQHIKNKKQ